MQPPRTVLVFSGGLDSTVLLHHLLAEGHEVLALSVHYGQRHARELDAAAAIARRAGVRHEIADLRAVSGLLAGSSLTSADIAVPEGHYQEESMKATVVPNRNMILLALAAGWAISQKAGAIAYAAHGGDHAIYPDCRPEFADAMRHAIGLADWHRVELLRPFVTLTKAEIVRRGVALGAPLAATWSCYQGRARHCGRCGTCVERREAFELAGVPDPTDYEAAFPPLSGPTAP